MEKTLVLGLGNPILSDDGVGLRVAAGLEGRLGEGVTVIEASLAGLDLLELLSGYDRAIIIDAIQTEGGQPGRIYRLDPGLSRRHVTPPRPMMSTWPPPWNWARGSACLYRG